MRSNAKNLKEKWEEFGVEMGEVWRREQLCAGVKLQPVRSSETKLQPGSKLNSIQSLQVRVGEKGANLKYWRRNGRSG